MSQFEVSAQARDTQGKGASRRLRHSGEIPAIVYGGNKEPANIMLKHTEILHHLDHEAFYSHILDLKIGDQVEQAVLKDVQRHPSRVQILHVDFLRVSSDHALQMLIPLHFINEDVCEGVKQGGGVVSHQVSEVEITCLPKDLPEYIEVDVTEVQLGQTLHLSDLVLPEGVTISALVHGTEYDSPVVTVHKGRGGDEDEIEEAGEESGEAEA
ncbi:50S ribosomal protein L25/general stress protein Ctc [Candidatus Venteria ishoeyi]|uniref:Large ribosomal subunit protein bL25 n=1 Tax=Candidatus Venteria ishoeyi TaxID=1899563 RepID=A0A1H6F6B6_9GAMM|nr:50S ribosomal protein L25/general stress protein Ctc [Candidatus Venteria ishoeyi]MDM8547566.1 50S ribosomal protein L25/general stress protein Ctc [Candidatus Venteria ishoeyi]SEH04544.1 50S ribosomal protein L25 [Candidatus Venteria ishoeyi]